MQKFSNFMFTHTLRRGLLLLVLSAACATAGAADTYKRLSKPQPTEDPDRIEVLEIFWYGCPHCNDFEPYLNDWIENKPDDVNFRRMPAVFRQDWLAHARAYYTALELGVVDKIHSDLFHEIHSRQRRVNDEESLRKFFMQRGVDGDTFTKTYNSHAVESRIKQALSMLRRYEVTGVPAVVVNGKYVTSGPLARSYEGMIQTINELIDKERDAMQQTSTD
ncbi:MAG: thiol:disulfide interchange protein DsbA/DsbL [Gammaproteobacteria bacterium]|nr:thiol:disulfide interchange protein DsbA/DsbL [Gammaproteobacteria bacterium]